MPSAAKVRPTIIREGRRVYLDALTELVRARGASGLGDWLRLVEGRRRHGMGIGWALGTYLERVPLSRWRRFMADKEAVALLRCLNGPQHRTFWRNKVASGARLLERGVPVAPVTAIFHDGHGSEPDGTCYRNVGTAEALAEAIDESGETELIVKPADGSGGKGVFAVGRDADGRWRSSSTTQTNEELDGGHRSTVELAREIRANAAGTPTMIQPRLRAHPGYTAIGGAFGLPTVRVHTLLGRDGPQVLAIIQKVLGDFAAADNFKRGQYGHFLCEVDTETGRLSDATGLAKGCSLVYASFAEHPRAGGRFRDVTLPRFDELVEVAKAAALAFPETPVLGNDFAITDRGVFVLEYNGTPGPNIPQVALRRGYRDLLAPCPSQLNLPDERRERAMKLLGD